MENSMAVLKRALKLAFTQFHMIAQLNMLWLECLW
jgi:hypothetical protein